MSQFANWWQTLPSQMNPVMFKIGGFAVHYYGVMYIAAFATTYLLCRRRMKSEPEQAIMSVEVFQGLITVCILGLILGARFGYVLFYNLGYYLRHPLEIILPFDIANGWRFTGISGMSFHGGLIGLLTGAIIYMRRQKLHIRKTLDLVVPCAPLGYTFGRIGNFINAELWGRKTNMAIGMYFPNAPGNSLRHPSQLYEAFFEGIVLFTILWLLRKKTKVPGAILSIYLWGYGAFRYYIEFVREPDSHLGLIVAGMSMGQLLCLAMILAGSGLYWYLYRIHEQDEPEKKKTVPPRKKK
ncbi:MAG: prolipoprotein diacylglyceryl transferase [Spirochaeta sp. LUC14_002_19_P3]|nr:MAG: prolipoprotein diacylglyceryl transferase [Spirochaeta sp. LUC14_002_19_P3]